MPTRNHLDDLLYKDECYRIVGACFEVYKDIGCGLHESPYQECLEIECALQEIPFVAKPELKLQYKGRALISHLVPDLVCYQKIVVELKALECLEDRHRAQIINYLKATGYELGLLVNFGSYPKLEWERILRSKRLGNSLTPEEVSL